MKKISFLFAFVAIATAAVFVACEDKDNDGKKPPVVEKDYPELAAVDGSYVIAVKFEGEVCNDIVMNGEYNVDPAKPGDWLTDNPEEMAKFEPIGELNGKKWDNWYKVVIPFAEDTMKAKPVQLDGDGKFDWQYQTGDSASWVIKAGDVTVKGGYSGEADLSFANPKVPYALISKAWKANNTPCGEVVKENVTFKVTVPTWEGDHKVYVVGDFNGWKADSTEMTKGTDNTWTATLADIEVKGGYKYVLDGSWDYEELAAIEEGKDCANGIENRALATTAPVDTVANFEGVTATKCE